MIDRELYAANAGMAGEENPMNTLRERQADNMRRNVQPHSAEAITRRAREAAEVVRGVVEPLRKSGAGYGEIARALMSRRIATAGGRLVWRREQAARACRLLGLA